MGEINMLEIGFIVRARRQQHGAVAARGGKAQDIFAIGIEEGRQPRHLHLAEGIGKALAHHQPVLQRIAQTARRVGSGGHHPPGAIGGAGQVGGIEMNMHIARRFGAAERTQELRMAQDQMRRQMALGDHALFAIGVAQDQVGKLGPAE